jgi:hypothetical protein
MHSCVRSGEILTLPNKAVYIRMPETHCRKIAAIE